MSTSHQSHPDTRQYSKSAEHQETEAGPPGSISGDRRNRTTDDRASIPTAHVPVAVNARSTIGTSVGERRRRFVGDTFCENKMRDGAAGDDIVLENLSDS